MGKKRKTLGGMVKDILRFLQSVPSPTVEPFKMWLATSKQRCKQG